MKALLCSVTLLHFCVAMVKCEMFTAMTDLERLLYAEKDIARDLKVYIKSEESRIEQLKSVVKDYESHSSEALENKDRYLGNPVNLYLLVKRFTMDFENVIEKYVSGNASKAFLDRLAGKQHNFPDSEDLSGSINALLRLQDTYQIPAAKMASGDFLSSKSTLISPELSVSHCFQIGKQAYYDRDYYHALMWFQEAYDNYQMEVNKTIKLVDLLDYLAFTAAQQGNIAYALRLTNELLELEPSHDRALNNKVYYEKAVAEDAEKKGGRGETDSSSHVISNTRHIEDFRDKIEFANYERLCRGEDTHPTPKNLKCRYVHRKHPLLWLNPAKEETMHDRPRIDLYHNLLSESEMDLVKKLAKPRLGRATVQNSKTGELETANYRISKSAWLKSTDHTVIKRINDRIDALTGLDMSTAEELQVANYGIGGHYEPHFDFARKEEKSAFEEEVGNRVATMLFYRTDPEPFKRLGTGNRIATMLFYMSDVEAGGATVFPHIGAKLFPKKGAGVFWYNLFKSGDGDLLTRHAACPVLAGIKWVSNKWIHERGQEFRRPCGLKPSE